MSAMSVMDWVVVGLFGGMVLVVAGMIVWVAWGMLRDRIERRGAEAVEWRSRTSHAPHGRLVVGDEDDGCDDVPFPEAIEHERGRVCRGCERKDGA